MGLFSYFQNLAAKAKKTTNSKEAKQIKDKLILIGAIMAAVGGIGAFLCFVAFGILGFNSVQNFGSFLGTYSFFLIYSLRCCRRNWCFCSILRDWNSNC